MFTPCFFWPTPRKLFFHLDTNRALSNFLHSPYLGLCWIPACFSGFFHISGADSVLIRGSEDGAGRLVDTKNRFGLTGLKHSGLMDCLDGVPSFLYLNYTF